MRGLALCLSLLAAFTATPAYAYIGPGAGAGTIAVVLGILAAICLAFVAILWYPFKRLIRSFRPPDGKSDDTRPDSK